MKGIIIVKMDHSQMDHSTMDHGDMDHGHGDMGDMCSMNVGTNRTSLRPG